MSTPIGKQMAEVQKRLTKAKRVYPYLHESQRPEAAQEIAALKATMDTLDAMYQKRLPQPKGEAK